MFGLTPINRNREVTRTNDFVDFYNMMDDFFNDSLSPFKSLKTEGIKVDVRENEKDYLIDAELPGFKKEDINLEALENELLICATKQEQINEERENYVHKERRQSSMQRRIYLQNMSGEEISAKFENGLLQVVVPKLEKLKGKSKIQIN